MKTKNVITIAIVTAATIGAIALPSNAANCRRPGDVQTHLPKCTLTGLPENQDLGGQEEARGSGREIPKPVEVEVTKSAQVTVMISVDRNDGEGMEDYMSITGTVEDINDAVNRLSNDHPDWSINVRTL